MYMYMFCVISIDFLLLLLFSHSVSFFFSYNKISKMYKDFKLIFDLLLLSNAPHKFICDSELYAHVQFIRVRVC